MLKFLRVPTVFPNSTAVRNPYFSELILIAAWNSKMEQHHTVLGEAVIWVHKGLRVIEHKLILEKKNYSAD